MAQSILEFHSKSIALRGVWWFSFWDSFLGEVEEREEVRVDLQAYVSMVPKKKNKDSRTQDTEGAKRAC